MLHLLMHHPFVFAFIIGIVVCVVQAQFGNCSNRG